MRLSDSITHDNVACRRQSLISSICFEVTNKKPFFEVMTRQFRVLSTNKLYRGADRDLHSLYHCNVRMTLPAASKN
jgi:hypothetical protein